MLNFVNYKGESLPPPASTVPKLVKRRETPDSFHRGWRVVGIPPGAVEEAEQEHSRRQIPLAAAGKESKPFDRGNWIMNAKKKPVRAKPYELPGSAKECAELAEKAGWLAVEIREIKKEKA